MTKKNQKKENEEKTNNLTATDHSLTQLKICSVLSKHLPIEQHTLLFSVLFANEMLQDIKYKFTNLRVPYDIDKIKN